ncbi:DUF6081 family protein [Streptomyces sp. HU2014]|uniref:Uncharacterized protein n=1 Tax=Streptomyces albireticuli TaxID=1940 RepID=A0A1Z2KWD6_9ACTN|nr:MULTISPECIES: DUF6081 family protein [Streptomyces]ARZ66354.1 hypothetical protein SMD11_0688 [Streptomyces albireticuli]UQI46579.1 DUF6081 family protein [Streptomyces sp. HU2014]
MADHPDEQRSHRATAPAGEHPHQREVLWNTDFGEGFATSGPGARWYHSATGPYVGDDGVVTTGAHGLRVDSSGVGENGTPAFVRTLAQERENGHGLPGLLDHVKWLAYIQHQSSAGLPGFDAPPEGELVFEVQVSGRTYGTEGHPFGESVTDPEDDLRLASTAVNAFDPETLLVVDFFLTNSRIYAFYERLPFARRQLGDYASFSYAIPVARRSPDQQHHLALHYDRSAGRVRWVADGEEVFRVERLGRRLASSRHLVLDHGGDETHIAPRQLNGGMGMFSLLDGARPGQAGAALVRLSGTEDFYFAPAEGQPRPQTFLDDKSARASRLFGQGASLSVARYTVWRGHGR